MVEFWRVFARSVEWATGRASDSRESLSDTAGKQRRACLSRLYDEFSETLVLARCYTTVPFAFLPDREKDFARRVATERNLAAELGNDASVLVLAATRDETPEWNDPASSRRRLAIPLLSLSCLETIPLVGRVLGATVSDLPWRIADASCIISRFANSSTTN